MSAKRITREDMVAYQAKVAQEEKCYEQHTPIQIVKGPKS